MATGASALPPSVPRELVLTRVFDAPRSLVFKAWTDPRHVARWWGPHRFDNPVCEWDARPGGALRVHMRGPDGTIYPMVGKVHEVVEPERLVMTTGVDEPDGRVRFRVLHTVTFEERDGKTVLTLRCKVVSAIPAAAPQLAGMEMGWTQSLERLEGEVTTEASGTTDREIIAIRVFDAPRELVFREWTDPQHVVHWWGPNGFTNTIHEMDVRPGGVWQFVMHGPDGVDYQNKIVFDEVVQPERLVYTHVSGPKFRVTASFQKQVGRTKLIVRMRFATAAELDHTVKTFGAREGLSQTLERLGKYLAKRGATESTRKAAGGDAS